VKKSRPVLVIAALVAIIQALISTAGLTDIIGKDMMSYLTIANVVLTALLGVYTQSKVTPFEDTAAYVNTEGKVVAGPASPPKVLEGSEVSVEPTA
jgi:hypothetical protein